MYGKIIFDCFGTLIDTGTGSLDAVREILRNVGQDIDAKAFYSEWKSIKKELMRSEVFMCEKELFKVSLKHMFDKYGIVGKGGQLFDHEKEAKPMIDTLFGDRRAFPDTAGALHELDRMGVQYAIGSTTDTDSLMHFLELNRLSVKHIFTSEDMRVYKPAPEFYLTIIQHMGWDISECLFVGDDLTDDVAGPHSIGMKAVLIDRNYLYDGQSDIKPDYIIHSLHELLPLIRKIYN